MKSNNLIISEISALVLMNLFVHAVDVSQPPGSKKDILIAQYDQLFKRIETVSVTNTVTVFVQLGNDIEGLPLSKEKVSPGWQETRKKKLELWLKLLNLCDQWIDPKFDPNDEPQINIDPPSSTGLASGVNPNAINNLKLRKEYEAAIKKNEEKASQYIIQSELRDTENQWSEAVNAYIKTYYTSNTQDVFEVKTLIDVNVANSLRKEKLKKQLANTKQMETKSEGD